MKGYPFSIRAAFVAIALCTFSLQAKIYDCFTFFNELDLLELKLHELKDHVDRFVIVESTITFQGGAKPLYFAENKERFAKFLAKIIHVVIDDHPDMNCSWHREAYQRNQIVRGLKDCQDEDIVIIEDLDEIIRPSALPVLVDLLKDRNELIGFSQDLYLFYMNYYCCPWCGSVAARYSFVKNHSPEFMRSMRNSPDIYHIPNAGWHFSWMGGIEKSILKLESFSHTEYNTPWEKDPKNLQAIFEYKSNTLLGHNFLSVSGTRRIVPITADEFPKYLVENLPIFIEKGYMVFNQ